MSGTIHCESASVTRPSANTPIVCVTVTISAEQRRVARRAALADQVGGHDRLAVPGRERVRRAPEERRRERGEDDERAQVRARRSAA